MVDVPSVVRLSDTPAAWEQPVQSEDGWWPTGGAVDPANDNGLQNWNPQILGRRDRFLRNMIEGAGMGVASVADVADFNAITLGGQYRGAAGTANAPTATHPYLVNHMAGQSASEAVQTAYHAGANRSFLRRRVAGVWQAWTEQWVGVEATSSFGTAGWQRLPSGLILQWGQVTGPHNTAVTFPIAFPNACFVVMLADVNFDSSNAAAHVVGHRDITTTGFTLTMWNNDTSTGAAGAAHFFAIGR